jgi:hypothetical protein
LKAEFGGLKLWYLVMLLASNRRWNRSRSNTTHDFESDDCAHTMPGASSVLRPSVPGVKLAGYWNASKFR